ncbi:hypothetical protein NBH00_02380 [Paraconexibacter antarcticus]|uniref:Delta-60 repeat protein n=1 Tax=Paraconexibacter antarcticus TaxID=2949664 RepID=A0ABY5DUA4_9ACTN|nr:hypothetical protein [Paraconexibacter antarcticus]UTI65065.1 hypothetical protein NBH00_02380 [Paraconexibacter antarcticus]
MRLTRLFLRATLAAVCAVAAAAPAAALAAAEPGPVRTLGSGIAAIAPEAAGTVVAAGSSGDQMLLTRLATDGTPMQTIPAGSGRAAAVVEQANGAIVVAGDDGGAVVRAFTPDGLPDPGFGSGGTAQVPGMSIAAMAIGPGGTIVLAGSAPGSDGFPRVALARLLPSGAPDPSFAGGKVDIVAGAGRNAAATSVAVLPDGHVVFAGREAPGLQVTGAIVGRTTSDGTLDLGFAANGVHHYDAQGGARAVFSAVTIDPQGRIVAAGADLRAAGYMAVFTRLSVTGALDPGFGTGGVVRFPASRNYTGDDLAGPLGVIVAGGGEIVGAGAYQDSGQRSAALWTLTAAGHLDPSVGGGSGMVIMHPTTSDGTGWCAVAATPDGSLFTGGQNVSFSGAGSGTVGRFNGFGSLAPPYAGGSGPPYVPPVVRQPSRLAILRAHVVGRRLVVLASLNGRATGRVRGLFVSHGVTARFSVPARRLLHIRRVLSPRARRGGNGLLILRYAGDARVRADMVALHAGKVAPRLTAGSATIDQSGFLVMAGTTVRRARGRVSVRFTYKDTRGAEVPLIFRVLIRRGRWRVEVKLPSTAAAAGGDLVVTYAGDAHRRLGGQQLVRGVTTVAGVS